MGRKKKKTTKPWCWYCNREFEDEKILLQHQKAKHFKCHICHKKLFTGPGLQIHCMQVHKENIEKVPNSIKGRDNITLEICGMDNIPEEDLIEHEKQKSAQIVREDDSDSPDSDASPKPNLSHNQPPYPPAPLPGTIHGPLPHLPPPLPPTPNAPPPTNPMQQMMMMYPQMAHMMAMNPMMMNQMMSMPPGMMPPSLPTQPAAPPLPPPGPPKPSAPQPLMSLMGVQTNPPGNLPFIGDSSSSPQNGAHPPPPKMPKPLFPSAAEYSNELNHPQNVSQINDQNYVPKIENLPPGSKIVHPEDDISLEEFRASHHKYKYSTSQYSAPAVPNAQMRSYGYHHYGNGNGY